MTTGKYDHDVHHRRSIRLPGYDYALAGAYFGTIVTHGRECLFGDVVDGEVPLTSLGEAVERSWNELRSRFPSVLLDAFVIMPNHVHGVIAITDGAGTDTPPQGAASSAPTPPTLAAVVRAFKSVSAVQVNRLRGVSGQPLWQRNYYEHIVRDEDELHRIREYIDNNPLQWSLDAETRIRTRRERKRGDVGAPLAAPWWVGQTVPRPLPRPYRTTRPFSMLR